MDKRHSTICEMTFRTAILAMRLNRKRLVVVLESELYIYDISNMQMLKTEKTSPNPNGRWRRVTLQQHADVSQPSVLCQHPQRTTTSCTLYLPKPHQQHSNHPRMRHQSPITLLPRVERYSYTTRQSSRR